MTQIGNEEDYSKALLFSAYAGDMNSIVPFLRAGGPVSCTIASGDTLLHAAADGWQHRMIQFLLLSGANINAQNKNGDTALHTLTRSRTLPADGLFIRSNSLVLEEARSEAFFELLRNKELEGCILNLQGANALHLAAHEGDDFAVLQILLARPDIIDAPTTKGATALALAILGQHVVCVKHLVWSGSDVNRQITEKYRAIDLLSSSDNQELRNLYEKITSTRAKGQER